MKNVAKLTPAQLNTLREAKSTKASELRASLAARKADPQVERQLLKVADILEEEVEQIDAELSSRTTS